MAIAQYDIVLVNLDPTIGSEIRKTRPCVVLSPRELNRYLQTVVIAPMTSTDREYPTRVPVVHGGRKGQVAIDQIRTIDKGRVVKKLGRLGENEIKQCKTVIRKIFVD